MIGPFFGAVGFLWGYLIAGKRGGKPSPTQKDITLRLIELAQAGKRVLRLKGGDPFMFGRGGEEIEELMDKLNNFESEAEEGN